MSRTRFFHLLTTACLLGFWNVSCELTETSDTVGVSAIPEDLFPIITGHTIVYQGYLRHQMTDSIIVASGSGYKAQWTVMKTDSSTTFGDAHIVRDSTRIPSGFPDTSAYWSIVDLQFQRTSPTGSGNIFIQYNIGRFYRDYGVQSGDSLRWIQFAKLDAGVYNSDFDNKWIAFDSTWSISGPPSNVRLQIIGRFEGREILTLSGQTFHTYKLSLVKNIFEAGSQTPSKSLFSFWLQPGLGPVKMILNSDGENYGHYKEFVSKNF